MNNSITDDVGGDDGKREKIDELIEDAIMVADSEIDFNSFDVIFVVHARGSMQTIAQWSGSAAAEPYITTCASYYSGTTNDGLVSLPVSIVSEFESRGTYAHEFGHCLDLPDLYDYNDLLRIGICQNFVGQWDLMGVGAHNSLMFGLFGASPAHLSSFCKIGLGWIEPSQIKYVYPGETIVVTIEPLELPNSGIYTVKIPIDQNRYYLVETRQRILCDKCLADSGIMIYLCDESIPSGYGPVRVRDAEEKASGSGSGMRVETLRR